MRDIRDCKQVDADSDAVMDKRDNELAAAEVPDNPWY